MTALYFARWALLIALLLLAGILAALAVRERK
jgi:hypothetical protein